MVLPVNERMREAARQDSTPLTCHGLYFSSRTLAGMGREGSAAARSIHTKSTVAATFLSRMCGK